MKFLALSALVVFSNALSLVIPLQREINNKSCSFSHDRLKQSLVNFEQVLRAGNLFTDESYLTGAVALKQETE
jgi:hypothetical protein